MLTAPVPVVLIFVRKLWKGWIFVMVFAGLIVGFLIRQLLNTKKDNEIVRLTGLQLIDDIGEFLKTIKSFETEARLKQLSGEVILILNSNLNALVPQAPQALSNIQAKQEEFDKEKMDFKNDLIEIAEQLKKLYNILNNPNLLEVIDTYLNRAKQQVQIIKNLIDANNLDDANLTLEDFYDGLNSDINLYRSYFQTVKNYLTTDSNYPNVAPVTKDKTTKKVTDYFTDLQAIIFDRTAPQNAILAINDNQKKFEQLPDNIKDNLIMEFSSLKRFQPNTELTEAIDKWKELVSNIVENKKMLSDCDKYLSEAFKANPNIINDIVKQWNNATRGAELDAAGGASEENEFSKTVAADTENPLNIQVASFDQSNLKAKLARSRKNYYLFNFLQTFVLAILISLGAFKSLEASFIGHASEFIGIFLFAFSLDISIANVVQFKANIS
ncbi:hypothetical protein [Mucilaginibacter psychrotolerans]|nr:hypothetical protein [Mucilaginibacter psychrotolerans]